MMFATQLFLILSVATVVLGQGRDCTYDDTAGTRGFGPFVADSAATLEACKAACNADFRCLALTFGGTVDGCLLLIDFVFTEINENFTLSRVVSCSLVDACSSDPCQNGATCMVNATTESFECICPFGFAGDTCEIADACSSDPCQNGATCIGNATTASFDCICPFGFAGDTCEIECDFSCPSPKACRHGHFQLVDPQDGTCPDFTCVERKRKNVHNHNRGHRRVNNSPGRRGGRD